MTLGASLVFLEIAASFQGLSYLVFTAELLASQLKN